MTIIPKLVEFYLTLFQRAIMTEKEQRYSPYVLFIPRKTIDQLIIVIDFAENRKQFIPIVLDLKEY